MGKADDLHAASLRTCVHDGARVHPQFQYAAFVHKQHSCACNGSNFYTVGTSAGMHLQSSGEQNRCHYRRIHACHLNNKRPRELQDPCQIEHMAYGIPTLQVHFCTRSWWACCCVWDHGGIPAIRKWISAVILEVVVGMHVSHFTPSWMHSPLQLDWSPTCCHEPRWYVLDNCSWHPAFNMEKPYI